MTHFPAGENSILALLTDKEWDYIIGDRSYLAVESLRDRGINIFEALEIVDLAKEWARGNR